MYIFATAFLIFFCVMAVRIAMAISRQSAIFREFEQSRALAILVFLFPLGPIALFVSPARFGWLPQFAFAFACYIPAFLVANRSQKALGRAGTDRVKKALDVVSQAFGTAVVGLIYIGVMFLISISAIIIAKQYGG